MLRANVALQDILDAANHTNLIDSPGLLSRNHQLFLGLLTPRSRPQIKSATSSSRT